MGGFDKNTIFGVAIVAIIIVIVLYFYMGQPATVGSVPEPAATGQTK